MKDYKFVGTQFMTVKEKVLVLKAWATFLKNGLRCEHFTERLYKHLSLYCSFIAHYDANGFHATYFGGNKDSTVKFLKMFAPDGDGLSVEYGSAHWLEGEYGDINQAMREVAGPYLDNLIRGALSSERAADLAEARRLLIKHSIKTRGLIPEWR